MAESLGGFVTLVGNPPLATNSYTAPALGTVAQAKSAVTDNGSYRVLWPGAAIWTAPNGIAVRLTAKAGGVAGDVKAIGVTIVGTDAADAPLTETLPLFTVNTPGSVTSVGAFKTVTSITIPAHDGTGATTSVGYYGGTDTAVLAAFTDKGVQAIHAAVTITNPDFARNITTTAGGTAADIKAVQCIVNGKNENLEAITETLPVFVVDTAGTKVGSKAFKTITSLEIPVMDGTGATVSFGWGAKLGVGRKLTRDTVLSAYLGGVREATLPTVAFDATHVEGNTFQLSSALNGTNVIIDYIAG